MNTPIHLVAIILGAGRSRRMGKPKLLLPWHGSSILAHQIEIWRQLGADVRVICANKPDPIQDELDRLQFPTDSRITNPNPDDGMFSSIRCASLANCRSESTHFAIILGDQPHLKKDTLQELIHFAAEKPGCICQPRYNNSLWHPVILPKQFFLQLADTKAETLRDYLQMQTVEGCEIDDPGLTLDIDVAADYDAALKVESHVPHRHSAD